MKVVVAGGGTQAEYIVSMFKEQKDDLVVINPSPREADLLKKRFSVTVYVGHPWRKQSLEEADAYDADAFVALCDKDTDNFVACQMAKRVFGAKKCICVVSNPKNVDLFKQLGIDSVVSASYLLGQSIRSETSIASLLKTLSLENDKITMIEAAVLSKYRIAGLALKDCRFPAYVSVAAIYRSPEVVIPKGDTVIHPHDTLVLVCAPSDQKKVMNFVRQEKIIAKKVKDRHEEVKAKVSEAVKTSKEDIAAKKEARKAASQTEENKPSQKPEEKKSNEPMKPISDEKPVEVEVKSDGTYSSANPKKVEVVSSVPKQSDSKKKDDSKDED